MVWGPGIGELGHNSLQIRSTQEISKQLGAPVPEQDEVCWARVGDSLTWGDVGREVELSLQNLLVPLKGNVPTYHVVEEDTQGPDSGWECMVLVTRDPLWGAVHPCPIKVSVGFIMKKGAGTKIDKFGAAPAEVHQDVLILDVTMDNSTGVAVPNGCHYLGKEAAASAFAQRALLCDVVKEILGRKRPLEDQHEALWCLKPVKQADHTRVSTACTHLP